MLIENIIVLYTLLLILGRSLGFVFESSNVTEFKFDTNIVAVDIPFYKLLLTLGKCKQTLLFQEQKAWGKVKMNRVLDIYYKSLNPEMKVSKVEIEIVINNTDCAAYSTHGIGYAVFSARMFIPTHVAMMFYRLRIYSCSKQVAEDVEAAIKGISSDENREDEKLKKIPLHLWPIRPDRPPHHLFYTNDTVIYDDRPRPVETQKPLKNRQKVRDETLRLRNINTDEMTAENGSRLDQ